jgi:hypothetical protein
LAVHRDVSCDHCSGTIAFASEVMAANDTVAG